MCFAMLRCFHCTNRTAISVMLVCLNCIINFKTACVWFIPESYLLLIYKSADVYVFLKEKEMKYCRQTATYEMEKRLD